MGRSDSQPATKSFSLRYRGSKIRYHDPWFYLRITQSPFFNQNCGLQSCLDHTTIEKILMGILLGLQKDQTNVEIKLQACKALGNSL